MTSWINLTAFFGTYAEIYDQINTSDIKETNKEWGRSLEGNTSIKISFLQQLQSLIPLGKDKAEIPLAFTEWHII